MFEYLKTWIELKTDRRAVTMLEYAIMGALVAVVVVGGATALGTSISGKLGSIATTIGG